MNFGRLEMNTITRSQWGAKPPKTPQKKIVGSVSYVIIHHTGGSLCCAGKPCAEIVRNIQHHHMKDKASPSLSVFSTSMPSAGWYAKAISSRLSSSDTSRSSSFLTKASKDGVSPSSPSMLQTSCHLELRDVLPPPSAPAPSPIATLWRRDPGGATNYDDIGFNWLVAQTGQVYEGRGWGVAGAAAEDFNAKAVSISLIGDFNYESPQKVQLDAVHRLVRSGVENGKIDSSYKLLGHNQVKSTPTDCPGTKLRELIREWPHFSPKP
ncbi:hypothetical protein J6590_029408 [Homalodisca vitripennis]|nr:hypothetical protein J6590_029408 [Homalodisca vitripennis]